MKKSLIFCMIILSLLCAAPSLSPFSSACYAAEKVYAITETELAALEAKLLQQSNNNKLLLEESRELKAKLISSQKTCEALRTQLTELSLLSQAQETRLETANKLLQEYEKEARLKRLRIKRQRNLYFCCFLAAGVAVLRK